jgi:hypothetical protein
MKLLEQFIHRYLLLENNIFSTLIIIITFIIGDL